MVWRDALEPLSVVSACACHLTSGFRGRSSRDRAIRYCSGPGKSVVRSLWNSIRIRNFRPARKLSTDVAGVHRVWRGSRAGPGRSVAAN